MLFSFTLRNRRLFPLKYPTNKVASLQNHSKQLLRAAIKLEFCELEYLWRHWLYPVSKFNRQNYRKWVFSRNTTCKNHLSSLFSDRKGDRTLAGARKRRWKGIIRLHGMCSKAQNKAVSKLTSMGKEEEKALQNPWPQHDVCQVSPPSIASLLQPFICPLSATISSSLGQEIACK